MGMYDYIVCRHLLPTTPPEFIKGDHQYQSKDLECSGATYEITEGGRIRQCDAGMFQSEFDREPFEFSGIIEFYSSNWCSAAYGITFTVDGEEYESVTYRARFVDGRVKKIVETEREREPALSRAVYDQVNEMFQEDKPAINTTEPEVGAEMYVLWGSIDRNLEGYPVKLIAKTARDWAFVGRNDKIETLHPGQLGSTLFHSEADAKARRSYEHRLWDRRTEYCKGLLQSKGAAAK